MLFERKVFEKDIEFNIIEVYMFFLCLRVF